MAVAVQEAGIADMSDVELYQSLIVLRRDIDRSCAREAQLLAVWESRKVWADDGSRSAGHRFARETGLSVKDAKALSHRARRLQTMPLTLDAFVGGELSSSRVDLLARTNQPNVAGVFERDESLLIQLVKELSFPNAVQALKYWGQRADEDGAKDKTRSNSKRGLLTLRLRLTELLTAKHCSNPLAVRYFSTNTNGWRTSCFNKIGLKPRLSMVTTSPWPISNAHRHNVVVMRWCSWRSVQRL